MPVLPAAFSQKNNQSQRRQVLFAEVCVRGKAASAPVRYSKQNAYRRRRVADGCVVSLMGCGRN
jgi:hypothetical protein